MAFSRAHLYSEQLQLQATFAKVFAHPERIAILEFLRANGPATVTEIADQSPLHFKAVSQHLRILRSKNILLASEYYPYTFYSVNPEMFDAACQQVENMLLRLQTDVCSAA